MTAPGKIDYSASYDRYLDRALSAQQAKARVAVDVLRTINRSHSTDSLRLYQLAVAYLAEYLTPAVPVDTDQVQV